MADSVGFPVAHPTDIELSIWGNLEPAKRGGLVRTRAHLFRDCIDWSDFYRSPDKLNPEDWESKILAGFRGEWFTHVLEGCERILDVGCGFGFPSFYVARSGKEVVGVDASASEIDTARSIALKLGNLSNVSFERVEETSLPFPDRSFDGASLCTSLECAGDARALLSEVRRVLRPGSPVAVEEEDRSLDGLSHPVWEKLRWAFLDDEVWLWYETRVREPYEDRRYMLRVDAPAELEVLASSVLSSREGLPVLEFRAGGLSLDEALSLVTEGWWSRASGYDPMSLKGLLENAGFEDVLFWLQPDGRKLATSLEQDGLLSQMPDDVRGVVRAIVRSMNLTRIPVSCTVRCRTARQ